MRIAVGSDHAGFELKQNILECLRKLGQDALDLGAHNTNPVDYPDFAEAVGLALRDGKAEKGILICGSGVGASVAANKIRGIRAGLCHDTYSAHQGVEHAAMNVLCLGSRIVGEALAVGLLPASLPAPPPPEARHDRRLGQALQEGAGA